MKSLYILLFFWQILKTESAAISSVEKLDVNDLGRYERSADQNNLNFDPNCNATYKNITPTHSMCLVDVGTVVNLTETEKKKAVNLHNYYRQIAGPRATNMQKMVWDDELARIATKWALQCKSDHDAVKSRMAISLQDTYIVQNMAAGKSNLNAAIKGWYYERVDFKYGTGSKNGKNVGNYTQIMQHMSSRVGCGVASCTGTADEKFYTCNYAIGVVFPCLGSPDCNLDAGETTLYEILIQHTDPCSYFRQGNITNPYKTGTSKCSDCPNSCQKSLCDCDGKLCYNSGKLDINTCTCACPSLYVGDQCQNYDYPKKFTKPNR